VLGVASAAFLVWGFTHFDLADPFLYRGGFLVFALASAALIVSVVGDRGPAASVFSIRPLGALGLISYGVYLFHWPLFLWLTEDRTGLSLWPLLALRVCVTVALAIVSYFLLEMPIRRGGLRRIAPHLRWIVPATAAAVILAGAVTVGQRDVRTDLAGLGEASGAVPTVAAGDDGVLDVLVVSDAAGAPVGPALRDLATGDDELRVTLAAPFSCAGVTRDAPTVCTNWRNEWPRLVDRVDPDVVLFQVTRWPAAELARLSGSETDRAERAWAAAALDAGFDMLSAKGATIVWNQDPVADVAEAVRRETDPFYTVMLRLTSGRSDTQRRSTNGQDLGPLVEDLTLYQRSVDDRPLVMVVGDSTARTVSYGLERWAAQGSEATVWSAATEGCGLADEGQVQDASGREVRPPGQCRRVVERLAVTIEELDPAVMVVSSAIFDLKNRRLDGWDRPLGPGDPRFDDYLVREYVDAYDRLSANGAKVVWIKNPCVENKLGTADGGGAYDIDRIRYTNDVILRQLAEARPQIRFFDMFEVLCPGGTFVDSLGGVDVVRTDGVHFSPEGSLWFAGKYGQRILDLGLN